MKSLSITRLRLKSWLLIPRFLLHSHRSMWQVVASDGFIQGKIISEKGVGFWTVTLWQDLPSMQRFMGSGAHLRAMPFLRDWCQEACVTHVAWDRESLPTAEESLELLRERGRFSFLKNPSFLHSDKKLPDKVFVRWERMIESTRD